MGSELLAALMFPALFGLIFCGIPIAFALFGTAFLFGLPLFAELIGIQLYNTVLQVATQYVLSAAPPFVFMGAMLEKSGIGERLFKAMQLWLGRLPGGLALATMSMAAVFAASTGIVGAVEVVIGMMAIPVMMSHAYNRSLIAGTICAGGSLGTMIPPSLVIVIYAAVAKMSVGQLFAGVLFPAAIMIFLFLGYIVLRCVLRPEDAPSVSSEEMRLPLPQKLYITATALLPALALIVAVLGSILIGVASPTEAASVGALGTVVLTIMYGRLTWRVLIETLKRTLLINTMLMMIVVSGTMFSNIFQVHGGNRLVSQLVSVMDLTPFWTVFLFLLIVFLVGFILDWVSVVLICLPVFLPVMDGLGIDPMWFAITMIIVIQTSYLTPPMAPSIFYLRSIAPPEIGYRDMYQGVAPFVVCQVIVLVLVMFYPEISTYLPARLVAE